MDFCARGAGFVGGDKAGAEAGGGGEVFAGGELVGVALPVADGAVVEDGVAGDDGEGFFFRDVEAVLADDDGELAFVVEGGGVGGEEHGGLWPVRVSAKRVKRVG